MRLPGPDAVTEEVDAFDLPEWLGDGEVVWEPEAPIGSPYVPGHLVGPDPGAEPMACDVLACDRAYPEPALPEPVRREAHVQWWRQQVLLVRVADRLTLVCPGVDVDVESALECLRRLAKAVGAPSSHYTAAIRL